METVNYIIYLACVGLFIAGMWKVFLKAGEPGWAAIIPIYNIIVLLKIIGKEWYWLFILLVPIVNIIFYIIWLNGVSKAFSKGAGYTVGLLFLPFVFFPILGFGKAQYSKPAETPANTTET